MCTIDDIISCEAEMQSLLQKHAAAAACAAPALLVPAAASAAYKRLQVQLIVDCARFVSNQFQQGKFDECFPRISALQRHYLAEALSDLTPDRKKVLEIGIIVCFLLRRYESSGDLDPQTNKILAQELMKQLHELVQGLCRVGAFTLDSLRLFLIDYINSKYTWFFPSQCALDALAHAIGSGSTLDVGTGTALLPRLMRDVHGIHMMSIDKVKWPHSFSEVLLCNGENFEFEKYGISTLLFTWPSPEPTLEKDLIKTMLRFLKSSSGVKKVIVIGTPPDETGRLVGCHGTQGFWNVLLQHFTKVTSTEIPSSLLHDCEAVMVFEQKK